VWHTAPVQRLEDLRTTQLVVGAQAPGTTQYDFPVLVNHLFGFKFKVITGYESTPKIHLAMEAARIQGNGASNWSTLKALNANWIAEKKVRPIAQWALRKHPELADVPMVLDLAKSAPDRQALLLALARLEFGRPFFLPTNVPATGSKRCGALRRHHEDPQFLADAPEAPARHRSADRRAGGGAGRAGRAHLARHCRPRAGGDGEQVRSPLPASANGESSTRVQRLDPQLTAAGRAAR